MKRILILLAAVLPLFLLTGAPVNAQKLDLSKISDIPTFDTISNEEFYAKSDPYEDPVPDDPHMAYRVRLPTGWTRIDEKYSNSPDLAGSYQSQSDRPDAAAIAREKAVEASLAKIEKQALQNSKQSKGRKRHRAVAEQDDATFKEGLTNLTNKLLNTVATYYGPFRMDATSRFEVQALKLDYAITARNWFIQYVLTNGFILEGIHEYSKDRIEALYVVNDGDYSYYVRTMVEINGARMTLVSYFLPEKYWKEEQAMQQMVVRSFRFADPETNGVEVIRSYQFLNFADFDYPATWRLIEPESLSMEGMDARLIQTLDNKTLSGEISIHIVSTEVETTLAQEVNGLREDIQKMGLNIGEMIEEPKKYKFRDYIYFHRVEVYHASNPDSNLLQYEYWLAILAESRYYYIVSMLTPARQADFNAWARNTEAFETVIESFRP
jgi:hypothetical protein